MKTTEVNTLRMNNLLQDERLQEQIVKCYVSIFNARGDGEWAEEWTQESARFHLFERTRDSQDNTFVTVLRKGQEIIGLSVSVLGSLGDVLDIGELPEGSKSDAILAQVHADIRCQSRQEEPVVLFFRELGIVPQFRCGLRPVLALMSDVAPISVGYKPSWVGCWTSRNSKLFPILGRYGMSAVYDFHDDKARIVVGGRYAEVYSAVVD